MRLLIQYSRPAAVIMAVIVLGDRPVEAQIRPIPLDTVQVEVDSRASAALGASTRAVQVIDAAAIRTLPAQTINDVLQWAFGVELMPRSPALSDVAIRGSSFEQVLILVDGARVRDSQTGHFNLNLAVPLDQIEKIEILRGPAASLYGSDAMGGVINVVTRTGGQSTSVRLSRGTFETNAASVSHRRSLGALEIDIAGSFQQSDGHRAGTDYQMGAGRIAVSMPVAGEEFQLDLARSNRDFGADGFYGPWPSYEKLRTTTASARWRVIADSLMSFEPRLSFRRNTDDFLLDRDQPNGSRNDHTSDQLGGEVIGRVALTAGPRIAIGLHGYQDRITSTALGDRNEWTAAASAEAAVGGAEGVAATAGVRADRLVGGSIVTSPALSVAWRPIAELKVRSSVGRSFRSPTWTERYYPQVGGNVGNPDLEPEEAWSSEIGIEAYPLSNLKLSGALFLRKATNLIDWARPSDAPQAVWMTRNVESADFQGAEVEVEFPDVAAFRVVARGAWTSLSSSASAGYESKYALRPQVEHAGLAVDRSFLEILTIGVRGARERRLGEASYTRLDARGALAVAGVRLWVDVTNAGDEGYLDVVGNPSPGRAFALGLEWQAGD